ncbi:MerR family transcriptional regulator [Myxococcota bacterium]|nr:MerR family transcriptional regulator [Myxococcota bacterium]
MIPRRHPGLYKIGQLAERVGLSVRRVRYLEELGLLPPAAVSEGATRYYSDFEVARVRLVERLAAHGLPFKVIARVFGCAEGQPDGGPDQGLPVDRARARLEALARELTARAEQLSRMAGDALALRDRLAECGDCAGDVSADRCGSCDRPASFGEHLSMFQSLLPAGGGRFGEATPPCPTVGGAPRRRDGRDPIPAPGPEGGSPDRSSTG